MCACSCSSSIVCSSPGTHQVDVGSTDVQAQAIAATGEIVRGLSAASRACGGLTLVPNIFWSPGSCALSSSSTAVIASRLQWAPEQNSVASVGLSCPLLAACHEHLLSGSLTWRKVLQLSRAVADRAAHLDCLSDSLLDIC